VLKEEPDAFRALARYLHPALDLRTGAVLPLLVGSEPPATDVEYLQAREESVATVREMLERAQAAGLLRPDVAQGDIGTLIIRLNRPLPGAFPRALADRLAHRHLDLVLDGLRNLPDRPAGTLPGPALSIEDLRSMSLTTNVRDIRQHREPCSRVTNRGHGGKSGSRLAVDR
jgi:hypothetical protein